MSASLRLDSPLILPQARAIRNGQWMSPYQAKEQLQKLQIQRGFEIIAQLKIDEDLTDEKDLIASFHLLSSRQKKLLIKVELDKIKVEQQENKRWRTRLLHLIPGTPLTTLDLSDFVELNDEMLFSILTVDNAGAYITSLNLSGCKGITDQSIQNIATCCPELVMFNINKTEISSIQSATLTKFNFTADSEKRKLFFPNLKSLSVKDCYFLTLIEFAAPKFIHLVVGGDYLPVKRHRRYDFFVINKIIISSNSGNIRINSTRCKQIKGEICEEINDAYILYPGFQSILDGLTSGDIDLHVALYENIGEPQVNRLIPALKKNNRIAQLTLRSCINDEHIKVLTEFLINSRTIKQIDLRDNKITDIGAFYIAKILEANTTVETLDLSNNQIGSKGFNAISNVLKQKNRTLKKISLAENFMDPTDAIDFAEIIIENQFIKLISIFSFYVTEPYVETFFKALLINRMVRVELSSTSEALLHIAKLTDRTFIPVDDVPSLIEWADDAYKMEVTLSNASM